MREGESRGRRPGGVYRRDVLKGAAAAFVAGATGAWAGLVRASVGQDRPSAATSG